MNNIERVVQPKYGPRFFKSASGTDMFEHRIDSRNCIGPRMATKIDKQNHSGLWAEYMASLTEAQDLALQQVAEEPKRRKR